MGEDRPRTMATMDYPVFASKGVSGASVIGDAGGVATLAVTTAILVALNFFLLDRTFGG